MARSEPLSISLTRFADAVGADAGFTVVWVSGEQDVSTQAALAAVIGCVSELDNADVLVDLSGVTFMDASVIGTLIRAREALGARSLSLQARAPSRAALRVLELCRVTDLLSPAAVASRPSSAPALATWVSVPAQRAVEDRAATITPIAPAAQAAESAVTLEAHRGGG